MTMPHGHMACSCCGWVGPAFLPAGRRSTPNRRCPSCNSVERHRLLAEPIRRCIRAGLARCLVEVGPSEGLERLVRLENVPYISIDRHRRSDAMADLSSLPIRSQSVELIVCLHVLEHVQRDEDALHELLRVLSPTGLLVLQVPERGSRTLQGGSLSVEARIEVFGQPDHLRQYGSDDFQLMLSSIGFSYLPWPGPDYATARPGAGLRPGQFVRLCWPASKPSGRLLRCFLSTI